jgi:small nuclear ribonucleoprotein (snRNP)-like protein
VYSGKEAAVEKEEMGVYFIRGDNITMVGQVDN